MCRLALAHGVRADFHVVRLVSFGAHEQREMPTVRRIVVLGAHSLCVQDPRLGVRQVLGDLLASSELYDELLQGIIAMVKAREKANPRRRLGKKKQRAPAIKPGRNSTV